MRRDLFYLPLAPAAFVFLMALSMVIWIVAVNTGRLLGFAPWQTALALLSIVLGSAINVPVWRVEGRQRLGVRAVRGLRRSVPGSDGDP